MTSDSPWLEESFADLRLADHGRALTLSERDLLLASEPEGFDPELAHRRVETWRREASLLDDERWRLRLEQEGLDAERFARLVGSPPPRPAVDDAAASVFDWLRLLREAWVVDSDRFPETTGAEASPMPDWRQLGGLGTQPDAVFLDVVRPLLDVAWRRLAMRLARLDLPPVLAAFGSLWAAPLARQLLWMSSRTLILELYVRRLEERLVGATPEERFASFVESLRGVGALELFATYPVLGRQLAERVEQWLDSGVELAERLAGDLGLLAARFADGEDPGALVALEAGLGDRHDRGRTVARLEFTSGLRVIYKPRSLALDETFQQLLAWLADEGLEPAPRRLTVVDRERWGWVEHVAPEPCADEAALRRFYRRQGTYLALLYALEATDFHHENLIAVGETPVLIDLESLFQPMVDHEVREDINPVATTVLRSGLLPRRSWTELSSGGTDVSGLGARRGQQTPVRELHDSGRDTMGFVDRMTELPVGDHLPGLRGADGTVSDPPSLWSVRREILDGFTSAYRLLCRLRGRLLEPGGWLDRFAGLETRAILRPTSLYARLQHLSFHPDYLQDALARERLLDKLWLDARRFAYVPSLVPIERRDLRSGDVPRFLSRTDSRDVHSVAGDRLENVLPMSGLALARRRIETLDDDDLERQVSLALLALASTRPLGVEESEAEPASDDARAVRPLPALTPSEQEAWAADGAEGVLAEQAITAAAAIGARLELLAQRAEDWISWFSLRPQGERMSLEPVGFDLYSGLGGIALTFAQLERVTGEARWGELARCALHTGRERVERQLAAPGASALRIGGYAGLGGWLYVLTSLSMLWHDDAGFEDGLLDDAEALRPAIEHLLPADEGLDVIAGAAGCVVALLGLYAQRPSAETLELAIACGDHLLAQAVEQTMADGSSAIAWCLPAYPERPLTGFAHGTAGIAWALARLARASGDERFAVGARRALAYERALFDSEHDNWPDLRADRREGDRWAFFHAWCHGAPGIGLSRLDLLDVAPALGLERATLEAEIAAAVRSTRTLGFGGSHCLCHGDLGNLELLAGTAARFGDRDLAAESRRLTARILRGLERDGVRCGLTSRVELPGLLTGLAGVAYGLLRAAGPAQVPSVLLLELPPDEES
ncbi:MAG: type 2 lanthipeptide synthetase LanM family protein [Acidobacteriota bacterium]